MTTPVTQVIRCHNPYSAFDQFIIRNVQEYDVCDGEQTFTEPVGDYDGDAPPLGDPFWGVYVKYKHSNEEIHLFDRDTLEDATNLVTDLNGAAEGLTEAQRQAVITAAQGWVAAIMGTGEYAGSDDEIEVYPSAYVYRTDDDTGYWVEAQVYVRDNNVPS